MATGNRWADLGPRVVTGIALALLGGFAIWSGGWVFTCCMLLALGGVVYEFTGIAAPSPLWKRILGGLLITLGVVVLVLVRLDYGLWAMIWLVSVVVASDVGAYFAGRMIGGPKLWPAVSPGKTISGAVGGLLFAIVAGFFVHWLNPDMLFQNIAVLAVFSALVSASSMLGDLAQSAVKRAFGVKDSGTILPGHGGLWDRFDGMIGAGYGVLPLLLFGGFA